MMEEIKIWAIEDTPEVVPLEPKGQVDTESLLEETLVKNPQLLIPGLRLIGRQTPMGGGALDLLGVDEDGKLVVFELKRGTLSRDAVAQIIDYASDLEAMGQDALASHISDRSGEHGIEEIEDFQEWYGRDFGGLEGLRPLRMFLVGLGADDRTERMVTFLANNSGMDISLLTFHGFAYEGKTLLAKRVRVEGTADLDFHSARRYLSAAEKRERLTGHVEEFGISELFAAVRHMFWENWPGRRENIGPTAIGLQLLERTETGRRTPAYARIDTDQGSVRIVFYGRAVDLCPDEFDQAKRAIPFETYRGPSDTEGTYAEVIFPLDTAGWDTHKERLTVLMQAVYAAWESGDLAARENIARTGVEAPSR